MEDVCVGIGQGAIGPQAIPVDAIVASVSIGHPDDEGNMGLFVRRDKVWQPV
jgi:hypothetical protein